MGKSRKGMRGHKNLVSSSFDEGIVNKRVIKRDNSEFIPKTRNQELYQKSINGKKVTFGLGPAGTGKSYVAGVMASDFLDDREVSKIIITRPAIEAGRGLGYLPGTEEEKYEPYFRPIRDILQKRLGSGALECFLKNGTVSATPLNFMRGVTFDDDAFVIFDEAQNATPEEMKMFLTRLGENVKVVINGDLQQKDIPGKSGLQDAMERIGHLSDVGIVEFDLDDIVRSGFVRDVLIAYAGGQSMGYRGDEEDEVGFGEGGAPRFIAS